jgi:hypothetical protein
MFVMIYIINFYCLEGEFVESGMMGTNGLKVVRGPPHKNGFDMAVG